MTEGTMDQHLDLRYIQIYLLLIVNRDLVWE